MLPRLLALTVVCLALPPTATVVGGQQAHTVPIASGRYMPFYVSGTDSSGVEVEGFELDERPVTVAEFLAFLRTHPAWRRDQAPPALAGPAYLEGWTGPLDPGKAHPEDRPVTQVSWFAARAYCRAGGARLPSTDEWEYVAQASETRKNAFRDADFNARILTLIQARPAAGAFPPVGTTDRNAWGVRDLHGLVWEWTADFNNQMLTGAARNDRGLDRGRFCAAGSVGTSDLTNYAAFLRWAYRTSLTGQTTAPLLGFRCAR